MESILTSIKKILGISEEYTHFDTDLIIHINSILSVLNQIGVGPSDGFYITDKEDKWTDFLPSGNKLELVKTYVYARVRLIFDPPQSSVVAESLRNIINEFEWRINVTVDRGDDEYDK